MWSLLLLKAFEHLRYNQSEGNYSLRDRERKGRRVSEDEVERKKEIEDSGTSGVSSMMTRLYPRNYYYSVGFIFEGNFLHSLHN